MGKTYPFAIVLFLICWSCMECQSLTVCVFVPVDQCGLGGTESVFSGRLVITGGAVFTEKLRNRSSLQFKSLAFDTEHLVCRDTIHTCIILLSTLLHTLALYYKYCIFSQISDAYGRGSLNNDFKACEVLEFRWEFRCIMMFTNDNLIA